MAKNELLEEYEKELKALIQCAKQQNFTDKEIREIFTGWFSPIIKRNVIKTKAQKFVYKTSKIAAIFVTIFIIFYVLLNVHQPTYSLVLRNVQALIYPGLKVIRFLTVPIIKKYPKLTDFYDESCLMENPFFYVSDMECWPCENVHSVMDLTGFTNHSLYQSGIPYIVKTQQHDVTLKTLKTMYKDNYEIFQKESPQIKSNDATITNLDGVFNKSSQDLENAHITWRTNKMLSGRLIRELFPRPYIISEWSGQSIERFIMIDGAKAPKYTHPNTECSYIFVVQASGERIIVLKPSKECGKTCRTVSVALKPTYVLWYNWWYWRPISLPVENSTDFSISYISSYC